CSAGLSGGLEPFLIFSLGTSRERRFLTPSGRRLLSSPPSGASFRGKYLQTRVRAPSYIWLSCSSSTRWRFFWWFRQTARTAPRLFERSNRGNVWPGRVETISLLCG